MSQLTESQKFVLQTVVWAVLLVLSHVLELDLSQICPP